MTGHGLPIRAWKDAEMFLAVAMRRNAGQPSFILAHLAATIITTRLDED